MHTRPRLSFARIHVSLGLGFVFACFALFTLTQQSSALVVSSLSHDAGTSANLVAGLAPTTLATGSQAPDQSSSPSSAALLANAALTKAPQRFVENVGQFDPQVKFRGTGLNGSVDLTVDGLWLLLFNQPVQPSNPLSDPHAGSRLGNGLNLKLTFDGANPQPRLESFNPLDTHTSFLVGDPTKWHANVPVWEGVRYVDLYPGINLEFSSGRARLVAQAGANLSLVHLRIGGGEGTPTIEGNSLLRIVTSVGDFTLPLLPVVRADGSPVVSANAPRLNGWVVDYPFAAPALSGPSSSIFVPANTFNTLAYSTFLGGTRTDVGSAIAIGADGAL